MYRLRPGPQKKESKLSRMVRSVVHSLFVGDTRFRGNRPFVQRIFQWLHAFHFSGTFRSRAATFCSLPGMMLPCGQFTVSMVVVMDLIGQQAMSRSLTGSTPSQSREPRARWHSTFLRCLQNKGKARRSRRGDFRGSHFSQKHDETKKARHSTMNCVQQWSSTSRSREGAQRH